MLWIDASSRVLPGSLNTESRNLAIKSGTTREKGHFPFSPHTHPHNFSFPGSLNAVPSDMMDPTTGPESETPKQDTDDTITVSASSRPAKRKRVALACDNCRERKIKCDGSKPICGPCSKRGEPLARCVYTLIAGTAKQLSEQE